MTEDSGHGEGHELPREITGGDASGSGEAGKVYEGRIVGPRPRREHPAQRSFWHSLDATEREAFAELASEVTYWSGTTLCEQDDTTTEIVVIKTGWVKVITQTGGHERIIAVRGPGDTVGERAAMTAASRSATVVALDDVRALVISARDFRGLLAQQPHMLEVLTRQEYERQAEDTGDISADDRAGVEVRLAGLLLEIALRRGGYEKDGAVTITLPMSAQELADWAAAPPEAVAQFLRSWRRRGIVHASEDHVTVIDAAGLERICGSIAARPASVVSSEPSPLGGLPWAPLNCSIFFTDIAEFGDPQRTDDDRRVVHETLYRIIERVFESSHVRWASCFTEDRGDGTITIVPPTVSTVSLVDPLIALLAAELKAHNRRAGHPIRLHLRAALHVGPVFRDTRGLSGNALIHAARMLNASILKQSLRETGADLAFMASEHVYDTVIRQTRGLVDPAEYRRVRFQEKEADITSWMYLAGGTDQRRAG